VPAQALTIQACAQASLLCACTGLDKKALFRLLYCLPAQALTPPYLLSLFSSNECLFYTYKSISHGHWYVTSHTEVYPRSADTNTHTHTQTHTNTHTCTHTHIHTCTHMHTYTHTQHTHAKELGLNELRDAARPAPPQPRAPAPPSSEYCAMRLLLGYA